MHSIVPCVQCKLPGIDKFFCTGNKSKKLATLEIIITLFKVYFRLNTLRLCKNLINAVNSRQFLPFESFPASQRVTYKYYTGRLAIFDENYVRCNPQTCPL